MTDQTLEFDTSSQSTSPYQSEKPNPIIADALQALPGVRHGFFTREGGVSEGVYAGLNIGLGSDDERERVLENRRRAAEFLGSSLEYLVSPHQVHSPDVVTVTEPWEQGQGPKADGVVTDRPGLVLGVAAADCGPVLFADADAGVIGAAHSGWKGAFTDILSSTVEAMEQLGARRERIRAVLGPTISQRAYEVGPEFVARFCQADTGFERFFVPSTKAEHALFNLPAFIEHRAQEAGIGYFSRLDLCTYSDEKRFYSYRRTTHRQEADYGRLLSAIVLA